MINQRSVQEQFCKLWVRTLYEGKNRNKFPLYYMGLSKEKCVIETERKSGKSYEAKKSSETIRQKHDHSLLDHLTQAQILWNARNEDRKCSPFKSLFAIIPLLSFPFLSFLSSLSPPLYFQFLSLLTHSQLSRTHFQVQREQYFGKRDGEKNRGGERRVNNVKWGRDRILISHFHFLLSLLSLSLSSFSPLLSLPFPILILVIQNEKCSLYWKEGNIISTLSLNRASSFFLSMIRRSVLKQVCETTSVTDVGHILRP